MSDSNRISLAYVEEVTYGTTPSGPPTLKELRLVSESLHQEIATVTSQEIRSDRQIADLIRNGLKAAGGMGIELSYGAYDDFFQAALLSANWTSGGTVTLTTISAASADNSFNRSSGDWSAVFFANEWIKASGFTNAANNGYFKIVSVTATKLVVSGGTLVNESAGASFTLTAGDRIQNGTTFRSFAIERKYNDLTNIYEMLNGMAIDGLNLSITADGIITGGFTFLGKKAVSAVATAGTGTNTAAPTNPVMNGIDNVVSVLENQSTFSIIEYTSQLQNNLRARLQVGTLGAISVGTGTVNVSGTLKAYFATHAIMDKFLNFTATGLAVIVRDVNSKAYVIDTPRVKYSAGQRVAAGINQDVIADLNWTAFRHETEGVTVRIQRWAA